MNETQYNEPAFPDPCGAHPHAHPPSEFKGMTLRDYFAGQAITNMRLGDYDLTGMASDAYGIADAMLAERNKP